MSFLEKYTILSQLGVQQKRKFCSVYLIEENETKDLFVLKRLLKNSSNEFECAQLRAEAKFSFAHPSLPQVLNFDESETEVSLVLKFKPGEELASYFAKLKKSEKILALKITASLFQELYAELSLKSIVHCDIKPSNILYDSITNSLHLLDFGLAFELEKTGNRKRVFQLGFSAPELILNQLSIVTEKSDVFSLAQTFWFLMEGKLPFTETNPTIYTSLQLAHPLPELTRRFTVFNSAIQLACSKPIFKKNLQKLSKEEIVFELIESQNKRMTMNEFLTKITAVEIKKRRLIPNIFPVSEHRSKM